MWETHLCHKILWPCGHMRSCDKQKIKHLLFWKTYGHQTWQGGNLWWRETMHEVLWPSPLPQNVWPPNFSGWCLMVSATYPWSCLTLASCVHEVTWKIKDKIFSLQQGLQPPNFEGQHIMVRRTCTWSLITLSSTHVRSCKNLKTYYLLFQNTNNYRDENPSSIKCGWNDSSHSLHLVSPIPSDPHQVQMEKNSSSLTFIWKQCFNSLNNIVSIFLYFHWNFPYQKYLAVTDIEMT